MSEVRNEIWSVSVKMERIAKVLCQKNLRAELEAALEGKAAAPHDLEAILRLNAARRNLAAALERAGSCDPEALREEEKVLAAALAGLLEREARWASVVENEEAEARLLS
ncbi:MAG: hypothetical protein WAZ14_00975 [Patescibacteria group bacterium]